LVESLPRFVKGKKYIRKHRRLAVRRARGFEFAARSSPCRARKATIAI